MTGSWYGSGGSESVVSMTGTSWLKCWSKYAKTRHYFLTARGCWVQAEQDMLRRLKGKTTVWVFARAVMEISRRRL